MKSVNQILNLKENINNFNSEYPLKDLLSIGLFVGGHRPKAVIALNEKTGEIRSVQTKIPKEFEYWILKFDGVAEGNGDGKIEYAYYLMAKSLGIDMSECQLYKENGRSHFMTKRFDWEFNQKHHLQTLCGIAHYDHEAARVYSYEQVFQVMRKLHFSYKCVEQFFKRMVFNIIVRNQGDHTKNISFLLKEGGVWRLAPAYDLRFAFSFKSSGWASQHQMTMNDKSDHFVEDDFRQTADFLDINDWKDIVKSAIEIVKNWPGFAKKADVAQSRIREISKYHRINLNF